MKYKALAKTLIRDYRWMTFILIPFCPSKSADKIAIFSLAFRTSLCYNNSR